MTGEDRDLRKDQKDKLPQIAMAKFLELSPPNHRVIVNDIAKEEAGSSRLFVYTPDISLYCTSEACGGTRIFAPSRQDENKPLNPLEGMIPNVFIEYVCRNCFRYRKTFAVQIHGWAQANSDGFARGRAIKIGEVPPFGPYTPSRVISLVGPDRELFLKGRRAESQGLGVGAFAYYRRIVENQKGRLVEQILQVAERVGAPKEVIEALRGASKETQFKKVIDDVRDAIPQALLINGHNPLVLLYRALSDGLHDKSDEDCLELATSIRVVLVELADRIGQALKEQSELDAAVSRLLRPRS